MHSAMRYFVGCPNYVPTAELVRRTVAYVGMQAHIEAVEVTSPEEMERRRFPGLPPVLVDGVDIASEARNRTDYNYSCRMYSGVSGLPSAAMLIATLQQ